MRFDQILGSFEFHTNFESLDLNGLIQINQWKIDKGYYVPWAATGRPNSGWVGSPLDREVGDHGGVAALAKSDHHRRRGGWGMGRGGRTGRVGPILEVVIGRGSP